MRNNSHFTLIMAGIAFLIFTLQATAEPVPKWELDNLWQEGVSHCLYLEDEPKWTREECVGFWDCYIVNLESLFENDYEGFRQLHYRMQIDTLTEEDKTHLLMIEFWCMFP